MTITNYSDETLMAYVDHELDAPTSAALEAAMQGDAELAARVARHRALRGRLRAAFDAVLDEAVPERLQAAARAPATASTTTSATPTAAATPSPQAENVVPLAPAREQRDARERAWSRSWGRRWGQWGALAACLMLGVWLGRHQFAGPAADEAPWAVEGGQLVARAELAQALTSQLASNQAADARVRVGISFLAKSGQYCRSFALNNGMAGLACKPGDGGDWKLPLLARDNSAGTGDAYRQAASATPPVVLRAIDDQIVGTPLDATAERDAVQHEWRRR